MAQFLHMLNELFEHLTTKEQDALLLSVKDSENMRTDFLNIVKS